MKVTWTTSNVSKCSWLKLLNDTLHQRICFPPSELLKLAKMSASVRHLRFPALNCPVKSGCPTAIRWATFSSAFERKVRRISIRSDKDGKFSARLPNGNYLVKVEPDDQSVKLIRQESEVVIAHQDVVIDPFFVQSFSVSGMVRTHAEKGKPISAAKISVTHDGKTVEVVTSDDGSFIVNNVKNSPISAKVTFEGFDFDVVNVDKVDPGAGFPTIVPARYLLTGKVDRDSLPIDTEVKAWGN